MRIFPKINKLKIGVGFGRFVTAFTDLNDYKLET